LCEHERSDEDSWQRPNRDETSKKRKRGKIEYTRMPACPPELGNSAIAAAKPAEAAEHARIGGRERNWSGLFWWWLGRWPRKNSKGQLQREKQKDDGSKMTVWQLAKQANDYIV
jgi:hypothetical protein